MSDESASSRLKRLRIRAWRRGTKEMDLILGGWYDRNLTSLGEAELAGFDALLNEEDHDIYQWVTGRAPAPAAFQDLVAIISASLEDGGSVFRT